MLIVASDYDGTLYSKGVLLGDVAEAVRRWRGGGNLFGLATGRDFSMTAPEADRWDIPVDFYVCMNGGAIYDEKRRLLHKTDLPNELIPELIRHPAADASMHIQLSSAGPLRVVLREGSWFPRFAAAFGYTEMTLEEALAVRDIGQISVAYRDEEESRSWEAALRRDFGDAITPHRNKTGIDINPRGVDKAYGLVRLLERMGWERERLHVVGDGFNDLAMIREFGGYTVPGAAEEVARAAAAVFAGVPEMLAALSRRAL